MLFSLDLLFVGYLVKMIKGGVDEFFIMSFDVCFVNNVEFD